ncbi:MAG: hypothetical protein AB7W06_17305 [Alphaproteobacteria bacterium]
MLDAVGTGKAMAKKRAKLGGNTGSEVNVRVQPDVARLAKIVAAYEDRSISDLVSELLRGPLAKRHEEHVRAAAKGRRGATEPKE